MLGCSWRLGLKTTMGANCSDWCEKFLGITWSSQRYQFLRRSPMNLRRISDDLKWLNLWWATEVLNDQVVSNRSFINGCSELSFYLPGDDCAHTCGLEFSNWRACFESCWKSDYCWIWDLLFRHAWVHDWNRLWWVGSDKNSNNREPSGYRVATG